VIAYTLQRLYLPSAQLHLFYGVFKRFCHNYSRRNDY